MTTKNDIPPKRDIYAEITYQLIKAIEEGPGKITLPWHRGDALHLPVNALTGNPYNGINILSLWAAASSAAYRTPIWATYRQWQEKGAQVKKGEKSSLVVFYKQYETEPGPGDEEDSGKRRVARASYVFNADQVEGFEPPAIQLLGPIERIAAADAFAEKTGAAITEGGSRAYYSPEYDLIRMPDEGLFTGT